MARFSQRAINNIVIFAMLIMIALFNFDALLPRSQGPAVMTLLPSDAHVLKIDFPEFSIERVASTFVYKGDIQTNLSALERVTAWQSVEVEHAQTSQQLNVLPYIVTVWLAGQPQGHVFAFYKVENKHVIVQYNNQQFTLDLQTVNQLIGEME